MMAVCVKAPELSDAFDFVSSGAPSEHNAYICRDTGKIYWQSDLLDAEFEDAPDDLEESDRYLAIPHKTELGLGHRLVLTFIEKELPNDIVTVAGFFRRPGAYARLKALLHRRGALDRWYEFESRAMDEATQAWCTENDIELVDERPSFDR